MSCPITETRNDTAKTFAYNSTKQLHAIKVSGESDTDISYDAAGNTLTKGEVTFTYNQRNRMATAKKADMQSSYRYNANGARSSKTVNADNEKVITNYLYTGNQLLAWHDDKGWHENILVNGEILATVDNGETHYHENDYQGKAMRLTNQSGETVWHSDWEPYRENDILVKANTNKIEHLQRFAGQILDKETGLYYNHFREYDPVKQADIRKVTQ